VVISLLAPRSVCKGAAVAVLRSTIQALGEPRSARTLPPWHFEVPGQPNSIDAVSQASLAFDLVTKHGSSNRDYHGRAAPLNTCAAGAV
jgi:hypothetical protein